MCKSHVALIGDIAFNGLISEEPEKNQKRFEKIADLLNNFSFTFANLEVPVQADSSYNEYKRYIHYSKLHPTFELLKLLNIGCVSLANNHIYDCKMSGLKATIDLLNDLKILHTGAGWRKEHVEPVIVSINGVNYGFLAYVDKSTNPNTEHFPELLINYLDPVLIKKDIGNIRQKVDRIIVSLHWGMDYSFFPTTKQSLLAYELIDTGADIIMGHHPHTIQPYEIYKNGIVFYSLGGLCFGDFIWEGKRRALKKKTKLGMVAILPIRRNDNFSIVPTRELKGNYVKIANTNIKRKLKWLYLLYKLRNKYNLIKTFTHIKETILDRLFEYFFGYYRNPFKQLGLITNIKKLRYIFRDYRLQ